MVLEVSANHSDNKELVSVIVNMDKECFDYYCRCVKVEWDFLTNTRNSLGASCACINLTRRILKEAEKECQG